MEESKYGEDGPVGLWQDPDFPPSKESIGELNGDEVPDIVWLRPRQFSSKYANKDRPFVLFDAEQRYTMESYTLLVPTRSLLINYYHKNPQPLL